jgi:predicted MFS family arabinose efflux permease
MKLADLNRAHARKLIRLYCCESAEIIELLGFMMLFCYQWPCLFAPLFNATVVSHVNHLDPGIIGFIMVPGAVASAMMGLRGGKLADHKGNSFVVYTASGLLLICFIMLSTFAGISPAVIAVLLILSGGAGIMEIYEFTEEG